MPVARSMEELSSQMNARLVQVMEKVRTEALEDMKQETKDYYDGGIPKQYKRTKQLKKTPRVGKLRKIQGINSGVRFSAFLNQGGGYTTGSNPTMGQVLDLANYDIRFKTKNGFPARPTVGKKRFWERAEKKMEQTLNSNIGQVFN